MTEHEISAVLNEFRGDVSNPVNHVRQNIKLSSKINKIRDIQLFYRNFVK